ncbi:MAG TPA: hypothetical protein VNA30_05465 [Mycobacteriales bacterium]|nr:hypothetical protein [Mycobacteriales bacterium]
MSDLPARRPRRAVGPAGAAVAPEGDEVGPDASSDSGADVAADEERLRRDVPPHHDNER